MSLNNLMTQQIAIANNRDYVLDEYGNAVLTNLGDLVYTLGYLEQADSIETLDDRDTIVSGFKLWVPAATQLSAFDRVVYDSKIFEVDGEPWAVHNPRTREVSHLEAKLKVVK